MDVGGQIANRFTRFVGCPVPDGHIVARLQQAAQAGNGGEAGAAPVNSHERSPLFVAQFGCHDAEHNEDRAEIGKNEWPVPNHQPVAEP